MVLAALNAVQIRTVISVMSNKRKWCYGISSEAWTPEIQVLMLTPG